MESKLIIKINIKYFKVSSLKIEKKPKVIKNNKRGILFPDIIIEKTIREIIKPKPLLRKKGKIRNIGKPGITKQNICLLIADICSISFVSTQIHISEIIER